MPIVFRAFFMERCATPTKKKEVVIRTKVICLDSDDDICDRRVKPDVKVSVRDRVPYRVRGMFVDYLTDDSEDEDYVKFGYNRVKFYFINDLNLIFAATPPSKESD